MSRPLLVDKDANSLTLERLVAEGDRYQVATCRRQADDAVLLCAKTVLREVVETPPILQAREILRALPSLLEDAPDVLTPVHAVVEHRESGAVPEPILLTQYVAGDTLFEQIRRDAPNGQSLDDVLPTVHSLLDGMAQVHQRGLLFCDLNPRHWVVCAATGELRYVATTNLARVGERPIGIVPSFYRAPEIRYEESGRFLRPCADVYAFGLLLTFLLTGEEPPSDPRSPLGVAAYQKLQGLAEGPKVWLSKMLQPMGKARYGRVEKMARYIQGAWPKPSDRGFGFLELPLPVAPGLSPGPLVSRRDTPGSR